MGAAFADQHLVSVFEILQGSGSLHCSFQTSLVPGKQNGEGCKRDFPWGILGNLFKYLAVCDHHSGLLSQAFQGFLQPVFLHNYRDPVGIQDIPDGLLLRQDQPSLWRRFVDRHYQDYKVSRRQQISDDLLLIFFRLCQDGQPFFQFLYPGAFPGADPQEISSLLISFWQSGQSLTDLFRLQHIPFIQHQDAGDLFLFDPLQKGLIFLAHPVFPIYDQHCGVCFIQHLIALFHPQAAQFSLIVDPRSVHHHHRA